MRKTVLILILTAIVSSSALAGQFGIGGYGGVYIPVVQQDQSSGPAYGIKGKISFIPGISLEPNINFDKFGDAEFEFGTRSGSKVRSYGIDAIFGSGMGTVGFKLYGLIGGGFYSIKRDGDEDITKIGWSTGLGFEIGIVPSIGLDIRGKLDVISSDGGGSKKAAAVTAGLNYYLGL
jgi:hypothetical protein